MKFLIQVITLMTLSFFIFATDTKALIPIPTSLLPQRNCAGDLSFTRDVDTLNDIVCVWEKYQYSPIMSLTTHFMDPWIRYVEVHCTFSPALHGKEGSLTLSRLTQISPSRASKFTVLSINSGHVQFNMYYTGTDEDRMSLDNNANIIFYLNKSEDYTWWNPFESIPAYNDRDRISCDFKVVR